MAAVKDLVEDWIVIRTTLVRQKEILKSTQMRDDPRVAEVATEAAVARVDACLREMNALLKEFARLQDR